MLQPKQIREHGFLLSATLLPALEVVGVSPKERIRALASHVIFAKASASRLSRTLQTQDAGGSSDAR